MTAAARTELAAGRWTVDPAYSTATFRVGNLGFATVTGTVPILRGTVEIGADGHPAAVTGELDLGAIDTGNPKRDKDLRAPKLLDLDRHPAMTFAADRVTVTGAGWSVTGRLTARGTTVPVSGDAGLASRDGAVTLTARTRLDRRDFGVRAPRLLIGTRVEVTVTARIRPE